MNKKLLIAAAAGFIALGGLGVFAENKADENEYCYGPQGGYCYSEENRQDETYGCEGYERKDGCRPYRGCGCGYRR
jgi:hypothetical protein